MADPIPEILGVAAKHGALAQSAKAESKILKFIR